MDFFNEESSSTPSSFQSSRAESLQASSVNTFDLDSTLWGPLSPNTILLRVLHLDFEERSEELLAPALLCHKEPARRIQSLLLGALERKIPPGGILLAPRWFFMA